MIEREKLLFLDQVTTEFDTKEGWVVFSVDTKEAEIFYQGIGKNEHLVFSVKYIEDREEFEKKIAQYNNEKLRMADEKLKKLKAGEIDQAEFESPIEVLEHFPEEFFISLNEEDRK